MNKFGGLFKRLLFVCLMFLLVLPSGVDFAATTIEIPDINITIDGQDGDIQIANSIQILVLLTILSLSR